MLSHEAKSLRFCSAVTLTSAYAELCHFALSHCYTELTIRHQQKKRLGIKLLRLTHKCHFLLTKYSILFLYVIRCSSFTEKKKRLHYFLKDKHMKNPLR